MNPPIPPLPPVPPVPPKPNALKARPIPPRCLSPYTLYQEVPSLQNENMTYIEYLMGILAYINQWIEKYNQVVDVVDDHGTRINNLEGQIESLLHEFQDFKTFVETQIASFASKIDELTLAVSNLQTNINDINHNITSLQQQIDNIENSAGGGGEQIHQDLKIRNPITGQMDTAENVAEDLFGLHRTDGLTAEEYDALEKTADEYIAYDMTAYQYAISAKTIMV